MPNPVVTLCAGVLLTLLAVPRMYSQEKAPQASEGFQREFQTQLDEVQKKIVDLAGAIPPEKYSWRPGPGVRSISEVCMHTVMANFLLPSFVGTPMPQGITREMEKTVTDKPKVIEFLKQSFDHIRKAIAQVSTSDLEKPADFFGMKTTVRDVFFRAGLHQHEHMGQLIAYARTNNVVPPWSEEETTERKTDDKK